MRMYDIEDETSPVSYVHVGSVSFSCHPLRKLIRMQCEIRKEETLVTDMFVERDI